MIDTTVGVESVTWYQRDQTDRRRIQITFQDALRKGFLGGEKLPGELELYGDAKEALLGRMSIDSPEDLDQLAKAIEVAAQHWRHCIEECGCFKEGGPMPDVSEDEGIKIISFGDFDFDEEELPEDPGEDEDYDK